MTLKNAKFSPGAETRPSDRLQELGAGNGVERACTGQNRAQTCPMPPSGPRPPRFPGGTKALFGPRGVITAATHRLPAEMAADGWYHLMPFGEHRGTVHHPDGETEDCIHVCDRVGFDQIISAFTAIRTSRQANDPRWTGLDVDADHLSHYETAPSARYGFLTDLRIVGDGTDRAHGLYCKIDWTPLGQEAVTGRVYSFLSAVTRNDALGGGRYRPVLLEDACVTNQPALPVRAFNRAPTSDPGQVRPDGKEDNPAPAGQQEKPEMDFRSMLIKLLGLAETATDQEIQAALDATGGESMNKVQAKCRNLEKDNRELRLGQEADAFCDAPERKALIKSRETVRARYLQDPEGTKAFFAGLNGGVVEKPRALSRGTPPTGAAETPSTDPRMLARQQQAAIDQIVGRDRCTRSVAFNRARQEKPDLFPSARPTKAE